MSANILTAGQLSGNTDQVIKNQAKTIGTLAILASSVSHELKNHLAAISFCAEASLLDIRKKANEANCVLDNLQLQIKLAIANKSSKDELKTYSIIKGIEEALRQYPLQDNDRKLITVEAINDFEYVGNAVLTKHVLFNLIKNSLRAIRNAGKGEITIGLESGNEFNKLIFRDTASGISKEFLPKIFELFESQSIDQGGTGIGLAFVKKILQSYGGDITCSSIEGKYTEFTLVFPCV